MKKRLAILTILVITLSFLAKVHYDTNYLKINRVEFVSDKLPEDSELTILQVTDLHNKVFGNNNEKLIRAVKKSNADIIVITGDLIDRRTENFKDMFYLIEQIVSINENVLFVSGNHEWDNPATEEFFTGLRERDVTILDNRNVEIKKNDLDFNIVGVADSSTDHENINQAFETINDARYTVLLSHSPGVIEKYPTIPADLTLSGHTHGGQVRLPFVGALVAPGQGLFPVLDKGTFKLGQSNYLYLDSGLGTSMLPIRFLNQSQISLITITNN